MSDLPAALFVTVTGAWLTAWSGREYWLALSSKQWRRVPAQVDLSQYYVGAVNGPHGPRRAATVLVAYRYTVNQRAYTGTRIRFGLQSPWERRTEIDANPSGAVREIAYDPREPSRSVLYPGPSALAATALMSSVVLLLLGIRWLISA